MSPAYILAFALIVGIVMLIWVTGGFGKKTKHGAKKLGNAVSIDQKFVQGKWNEIENMFSLGGASSLKSSIIEADKLVDYVLKNRGTAGDTMGERLKNAKSKFGSYQDYDNLWFAHKVRNNIAHETTHELGVAEAKRAIEYFKKALKELGVL